MERAAWQGLFKKRFTLQPDDVNAKPGETTYLIKDKEILIVIQAATPAGTLRALSVTDTDECLVLNRGQGRYAYVDWSQIEAIATMDI